MPFGIVTRKDYRLIRSRIKHQIKDYRREAAGINAGLRIIGRPLILRQGPNMPRNAVGCSSAPVAEALPVCVARADLRALPVPPREVLLTVVTEAFCSVQ